uniref:Uncharacterized protein n=1 Tax=Enhalus acoroides TaxID=55455 RepID=A0A7G7YG95_9LILI|nr:hypothetical protein [Enhalus acoroides]QNH93515.1 hypothetical protein [Enhalus acoroides]
MMNNKKKKGNFHSFWKVFWFAFANSAVVVIIAIIQLSTFNRRISSQYIRPELQYVKLEDSNSNNPVSEGKVKIGLDPRMNKLQMRTEELLAKILQETAAKKMNIDDDSCRCRPKDGLSVPEDGLSVPKDGLSVPEDGLSVPEDGLFVPKDGLFVVTRENFANARSSEISDSWCEKRSPVENEEVVTLIRLSWFFLPDQGGLLDLKKLKRKLKQEFQKELLNRSQGNPIYTKLDRFHMEFRIVECAKETEDLSLLQSTLLCVKYAVESAARDKTIRFIEDPERIPEGVSRPRYLLKPISNVFELNMKTRKISRLSSSEAKLALENKSYIQILRYEIKIK